MCSNSVAEDNYPANVLDGREHFPSLERFHSLNSGTAGCDFVAAPEEQQIDILDFTL
jgi:hypothetical protein